jgi:hypothetical protein
LFGLFAAIFFCPPIGGQKKDFRFYPAAVEQKIFIQLLPKRRLTRRLKRRLKQIKRRKNLCDLAPLRALRKTKNVAHFAIFASLREIKNLCDLAPLRALRETKNVAHFASLRETKNKKFKHNYKGT